MTGSGPETFVSLYPELSPGAAAEVNALQPMDQLFGQVIGTAPVVLAHAGVDEAPEGQPPIADAPISGTLPPAVDQWPMELAAIPELDDVALGHGLVNGRPDSDGVVRRVPLVMRAGGKPRPGFALEIARNSLDAESLEVAGSKVRLGSRSVPIDRHGRMWLHFGTFPADKIVSAADVLGGAKHLGPRRLCRQDGADRRIRGGHVGHRRNADRGRGVRTPGAGAGGRRHHARRLARSACLD